MPFKDKADKAAYMRNWRRLHPLTVEQRFKDISRSKAGVYKRRGILVPQPCELCSSTVNVEMHHIDYHYPLIVVWLCRSCHVNHHKYNQSLSLAPLV